MIGKCMNHRRLMFKKCGFESWEDGYLLLLRIIFADQRFYNLAPCYCSTLFFCFVPCVQACATFEHVYNTVTNLNCSFQLLNCLFSAGSQKQIFFWLRAKKSKQKKRFCNNPNCTTATFQWPSASLEVTIAQTMMSHRRFATLATVQQGV